MGKNAFQLTEADFAPLPGRNPLEDVRDLSSEIEKIWQDQQRERRRKKLEGIAATRKNFMEASHAEYGKTYSICIEEEGQEKIVKAEFLGRGRREWRYLAFFRRALKNGKHVLHGIQEYSLVKEVQFESREPREQD